MIKELIELLKQFGFGENLLIALGILAFGITVISGVIKLIHWIILRNNQWLLNENLRPYFSSSDVDRATRYYIPMKFQNLSPLADDEPGKGHFASAKNPVLPMFLEKVFKNNGDNTKYYLILADAGMGKTTFMINLFLSYTARPIRNLFGWNENQKMKLFPLGAPDIWKDIEKIENKRDTILLLDAFDEDIKAVDNYDARIKEILEATREFKEIVITCRTQFFPSDKEIPDDTGYTTFGGEQDSYKFERIYLSVFDEKDVKKYLRKRFPFFHRSKRKKGFEIVKKSPNLVMRPMLLSYINDFVEENHTFQYSNEIYEVLIKKWIERESKKHGIREKYGSEKRYGELLLNFSQNLAINLYENREERGGYFITRNDFIKDTNGLQITDIDDYRLSETEIRSKSLLNRDAEGKYKFSHKSILEYFLARELNQNGRFLSTFEFEGMSAAEMFLNELIEPIKKLKGIYSTSDVDFSRHHSNSLVHFTARGLPEIRILKIDQLADFNILRLSLFTNLEKLIIHDKQKYKFLYYLYWWYWRDRLDLEERKKLRERFERLKCLEVLERLEWLEPGGQLEMQELNDQLFKMTDNELIKTLQPIEDFLKDMKLLQEKLPNCKMIY